MGVALHADTTVNVGVQKLPPNGLHADTTVNVGVRQAQWVVGRVLGRTPTDVIRADTTVNVT